MIRGIRLFLALLFLIIAAISFSQKRPRKKIVDIEPIVDVVPFSPSIQVQLQSTLSNGKKRKTGTNNPFDISWNKFSVSVSYGKFKDGKIILPDDIHAKGITELELLIRPLNNPDYAKRMIIPIVHLQKIVLHLQQDRPYLPKERIPLTAMCRLSDGRILTWSEMPEQIRKHILVRQGNCDMAPPETEMPAWEGQFQSFITLKPIYYTNDSIGTQIRLRYETKKEIVLLKNGQHGRDGRNGRSASGKTTNGKDGMDGEWGENGENGEHAPDLAVYLDKIWADSLAYVKATIIELPTGAREDYFVQEEFFQLKIDCNGGNGGNGGDGGPAGDGIDGPDSKSAGRGGNGGNGGYGGHGGNGGQVEVIVSEANKYLSERVWIKNEGGIPGQSGKGGKKGRGGYADKQSKSDAVFYLLGSRGGSSGDKAPNASVGKDGGTPRLTVQPEK